MYRYQVAGNNPKLNFKHYKTPCACGQFPSRNLVATTQSGRFFFIVMKPKMLTFLYHSAVVNFDFNPLNSNMMINATQMAKIFNKRIDNFLRLESTIQYMDILKTLPKDEKLWFEFPHIRVNSTGKNLDFGAEFPHFRVNSDEENTEDLPKDGIVLLRDHDILQTRGHQGTWMHRLLAIEFASWLDPSFKLWINLIIENLIFGNYKKHFEASAKYEDAKARMDFLRYEIERTGSKDLMLEYFECERTLKKAANDKRQASKQTVNLFNYQEQN